MVFIFLPLSLGGTIFYWLFERRGTILLLGKFGRRLVETLYLCPNNAGGWLECHFVVHALLGWLVIWIKLFYWCGLVYTITHDIMDEFIPYNAAHISQK